MSKTWEEELAVFDDFVSYPEAKDYLKLKKKVALSIAKQKKELLARVREEVILNIDIIVCNNDFCQASVDGLRGEQLKKLEIISEEGKE